MNSDKSGKLKLDETKAKVIDRRIGCFVEKTNQNKLTEAIEFDGISVCDSELSAVLKRNDCLHGHQTLGNADSLNDIKAEIARFDTLRTLINKVVLARLGYRGPYVGYSARQDSGPFPVRNLAEELRSEGAAKEQSQD